MSRAFIHSVLMEPEAPQPLHKPDQLTRFPRPNPSISTSSAVSSVYYSRLFLNENWN
jgi:hypothetical protein